MPRRRAHRWPCCAVPCRAMGLPGAGAVAERCRCAAENDAGGKGRCGTVPVLEEDRILCR